jgi:hypothetical protein
MKCVFRDPMVKMDVHQQTNMQVKDELSLSREREREREQGR